MMAHLHLARQWPMLIQTWSKVDAAMQRDYGYPKSLNIRVKIIIGVALALSISKVLLLKQYFS